MTGLNLETFLHLLRADLGAWVTLGLIGLVLALMAWTSWGSRRALRKCLVLSIMAHVGLALYGGTVPMVLLAHEPGGKRSGRPRSDSGNQGGTDRDHVEESPARALGRRRRRRRERGSLGSPRRWPGAGATAHSRRPNRPRFPRSRFVPANVTNWRSTPPNRPP